MKNKRLKISLVVLGLLIIGIPGIDLIIAKSKTDRLVQGLLNSKNCTLELDSIGEQRIADMLMVEDPGFYSHKGLDFRSPGAGWTTISQGLVKLFYFKQFHPGLSKIRLMLITRLVFDPSVSKADQLKLFYSYAYLGNYNDGSEIHGFSNGAKFYFRKNFSELTHDEYLSLTAMLLNPNRYRIDKYPERNRERVERIKKLIRGECQPIDWKDCELEGCK
ncbi:transglycosylase domain-containing protein [Prolixibacter denitrificans]|uniref:Transglycosylase n=1 Tax=Prolixibacter denitrificans TaxID=1541063 RepID=A0A2P8CFD5_9BACT|nr:transglycosylase domain-containing protein [Prolixibacter denitrificans]PSK83656.1 transglycosylase [Prolixibacter denitrificans]GET23203.1 hypothetical protein JCM18694_34490 [Prolixibacter denitrificans]